MQPRQLADAEVAVALAAPAFLLLKHSLVCPISTRAFAQYERFLAGRDDVCTGWIDVIGQRPVSREVERRTGVKHESPQALLLRGGEAIASTSHGGVTAQWLAAAWGRLLDAQSRS